MKYVVVSNFPDDECIEGAQQEFKTKKEAYDAFVDCINEHSKRQEDLIEAGVLGLGLLPDNNNGCSCHCPTSSPNFKPLPYDDVISPPIAHYYVGEYVLSIYRKE